MVKIKTREKEKLFILLSNNQEVFGFDPTKTTIDLVAYSPDHNLDEESWFKIENFSQQDYCLDFLKKEFVSAEYNNLKKNQFDKIDFFISKKNENFYFQKVSPSMHLRKKLLCFDCSAYLRESGEDIAINPLPDAIYLTKNDTLIFKNLATISSIFKGIDTLYKEATKEDMEVFLKEGFVTLSDDFNIDKISKANRKLIMLVKDTIKIMSNEDKDEMLLYIHSYCEQKLKLDEESNKFEITTNEALKYLLYGIEQRFYTTPLGEEKRMANSIISLS